MPDITRMGSVAPLFEQREIETPQRRGHVPIAETSREAWEAKKSTLSYNHLLILTYLANHRPSIHEEIANALDWKSSSSGRMGELEEKGLIADVGRKLTSSGRKATLYAITDAGRKAITCK